MNRKKLLALLGCICLVLMLAALPFMSACAKPAPPPTPPAPTPTPTPPAPPAEPWPKILTGTTTGAGTCANICVTALMKEIEDKHGIPGTVSVAHSHERVMLMAKGEAEISLMNLDAMMAGAQGTGAFAKEGKQPLRFLVATYNMVIHNIFDPSIKSWPELEGKKCMFDLTPVPWFMMYADAMFKFHGMTRDDVTILKFSRASEPIEAKKAGTIDAMINVCGGTTAGSPMFVELALATDVVFLPVTEKEIEFVCKEVPFFSAYTFPAGQYKGQDKALLQIGQPQTLAIHKDLPEDLVYEIAKILYDGCGKDTSGDFVKYHKNLAWTLQDQIDALYSKAAPFHPGVVKYMKERGVWGPEEDKIQAELEALVK